MAFWSMQPILAGSWIPKTNAQGQAPSENLHRAYMHLQQIRQKEQILPTLFFMRRIRGSNGINVTTLNHMQ